MSRRHDRDDRPDAGTGHPAPLYVRACEMLLRAFVPPGLAREGLLGDLRERHVADRSRRSAAAALRYVRETISACARYGWERLRRTWNDRRFEPRARRTRAPQSHKEAVMDSFLQDLRFSFRTLGNSPGFTAVAVLTLGLGIGVNAAIFSVVNAFLLQPLPVSEPDELVVIAQKYRGLEFPVSLSYPDFVDLRENNAVVEDLLIHSPAPVSMEIDGAARRRWVEMVSANYFDMLGVEPTLGRGFVPEEGESPGGAASIVLQHSFWQRELGGDRSVIGGVVRINDHPYTVVGVAPEGFDGTEFIIQPDAFVPVMMAEQIQPGFKGVFEEDARSATLFRMMGRLQDGVSVDQARDALNTLADEIARRNPDEKERFEGLIVVPETRARPEPSMAGTLPPVAAIFMSLVGLVLLIACANVANLLLARASGRRKEMAVRSALGAGRWRVVRQLLTESTLLGILGAGVGVLMAYGVTDYLAAMLNGWPLDIPLHVDLAPDVRVFLFTVAVAVLTGVLAGVVPAFQASRRDLAEALKEGGRTADDSSGRGWTRSGLVVAQVAVSLVLLVAGGLFLRSLQNARDVDLGFRTDHLLMASMDPSLLDYDGDRRLRFYERAADRLSALPGARAVTYAGWVPFGGTSRVTGISSDTGPTAGAAEEFTAARMSVAPGYFRTVGTTVLQGRGFDERDTEDGRDVAVINRAAADRLWPGEDPLGRRVSRGDEDGPWAEVVGVVENGKFIFLWEGERPALFLPSTQDTPIRATFYVHTEGEPTALAGAVRSELRELEPGMPVYDVRSMATHLEDGTAFMLFRIAALLVGSFGALGLILATVGLYGVVSYGVGQRVHELGIRMAMGADARDVVKLVLGHGAVLTGVGLALGLLATLLVTRPMGALLIGVSPTDPLTIGAVAAFLLVVSLVAAWVPARRAARVDPMVALRDQ